MGKPLTYRGLMKTDKKPMWERALANKFGRLMQGVGTQITQGTETLFPIEQKTIPKDRSATYAKIVVDIRPQKKETHRARLVVGGDCVDYPYKVSTKTVDLDTTNFFFQFCHFYSIRTIHENGYQQFLPWYKTYTLRVYPHAIRYHSTRNHRTIPFTRI